MGEGMAKTKTIAALFLVILVISLLSFIPMQVSVNAESATLGNTTTGSTTYPITQEIGGTDVEIANGGGASVRACPIVASKSGTVTHVGINCGTPAGANIMVAIYSGDADSPLNLLAQSASTAAVAGWNDLALSTTVSVVAGSTYWLAFENDNDDFTTYRVENGTLLYYTTAYGTFPNPFSVFPYTQVMTQNMRITYEGAVNLQGAARATKAELSLNIVNVTSMSFYSSATGGFRLAIYNGTSAPSDLLWQSGAETASVGWNNVTIASGSPTNMTLYPGTYWLVYQWDSANAGPNYISGSSGTGNTMTLTYGEFPATWTDGVSTANEWSIFATYDIIDVIPEGLSIVFISLLSVAAVIIATFSLRKRENNKTSRGYNRKTVM
jgi:hypothetical protein